LGRDGQQVAVPKGTNVQITTWSRHRNPDLWGADVDEFNPDREWQGDELWGGDGADGSPEGRGFMAFNPSSRRFSPFTYGPRDCIGKNFVSFTRAYTDCPCMSCVALVNVAWVALLTVDCN
jgi:cytochrome P450